MNARHGKKDVQGRKNGQKIWRDVRPFVLAFLTLVLTSSSYKDGYMHLYMGSTPMESTCLLIGLVVVGHLLFAAKDDCPTPRPRILASMVAVPFAVCTVAAKCYNTSDIAQTMIAIFKAHYYNRVSLIVLLCSAFWLWRTVVLALPGLAMRASKWWGCVSAHEAIEHFLFGRFGALRQYALFALVWGPQLFVRYPGSFCRDAFDSLAQYQGILPYTTKHPVIYALTLGWFIDKGLAMGHANWGAFLLLVTQTALLAAVAVHTVCTTRAIGAKAWSSMLTFVAFLFSPVILSFSTTAIKDMPFLIGYLLLMNELVWILYTKSNFRETVPRLLAAALGTLLLFYRNNGTHLALAVAAPLAVWLVVRYVRKHELHTNKLAFLTVILVCTLTGKQLTNYLNQRYQAQIVSSRVIYASVIQQLGRYLALYPDDVSNTEYAQIRRVMDVDKDEYARGYNPLNFDHNKQYFRKDATSDDIHVFLSMWVTLGRRHPDVYLASILHQNYALFSPFENNYRIYNTMDSYWIRDNSYDFSTIFSMNKHLGYFEQIWQWIQETISRGPFVGLFANCGVMNLLFLGMLADSLKHRHSTWLVLAVPSFVTLGITFFGPAFMLNPRYLYPLMWAQPLLAAAWDIDMTKSRESEKQL